MATLGFDVGCISIKAAVVGGHDDRDLFAALVAQDRARLFVDPSTTEGTPPDAAAHPVLATTYRRILGSPGAAATELLEELTRALPPGLVDGIRVTGSGSRLLTEHLGLPSVNEFKAIARGISALHPAIKIVFEMGGETSKLIRLDEHSDGDRIGITDYCTNGDCAAGTGSFLDQQAGRLLYRVEDIGEIVAGAGRAATVAGRCSVFAKSDMIHAQQKGYQPPEVLRGLCDAVVRNFKATIARGKVVDGSVAFVGGVAANSAVVRAFLEAFELRSDQLVIPVFYAWMGAIGAALIEAGEKGERLPLASVDTARLTGARADGLPTVRPLSLERVILLRDRVRPYRWPDTKIVDAYLGIDVGSVSTNLAVLDEDGEVIHEIYVKTDGRPIEVVSRALSDIRDSIGHRLRIRGVGTTGSGRELIGELTGADTVADEVTAHKTGATFVGRKLIDRIPDTIFEIGGQDSKFISLDQGVVVDFTMNQACAAGTGSFLEEQAERLGISIIDEFARLALGSSIPVRLGERCTVFMERDVNSYVQRGAGRRDLVAGLAYSIVHNYLNRVVAGRRIGDHIFFQGGTAYNDAVAAAFSMVLGKEIIVPPHNGVLGAVGVALLAKEKMEATGSESRFRGWDVESVHYTVKEFVCRACSNDCDIRRLTIEGEHTFWGDKCSDKFRKPAKVDVPPLIPDLLAARDRLLFSFVTGERVATSGLVRSGSGAPRGTVGIPRTMYTFDRLPFWSVFLQSCGFDVIVSEETDRHIRDAGVDASVAEPCFPIRVAHGHVRRLLAHTDVDLVLVPNVRNEETDTPAIESHACVWGQTLPFVLAAAPAFEAEAGRFLRPTIHFRRGPAFVTESLTHSMKKLGVGRRVVERAVQEAYAAQRRFQTALLHDGAEALATLEEKDALGIVLLGRSYNIHDRGVNMDLAGKLRRFYGVNVVPLDFLPVWSVETRDITPNMFWSYGRKILQAARVVSDRPNLHLIYITNFKCGPDSYVKQYIRAATPDPFLTLQFDEHTNDAGVMTRCEAYLDSKGFLRWWARRGSDQSGAEERPA